MGGFILAKKIIACILAIVLLLCITTACKKNTTAVLVRVNEVTHSVFYAPFYVAINQGFFTEEGIKIELINGGGADKSMTALLSNQADIGFMGPEAAVYVYNEGKENHPVIIGQVTKRDGSFLVGKVKDTNFTWDKVKGKSIIGGRKGGMPEMTLEHVLRKNGIIPNQDATVRTDVQFNLMGGAFMGGTDDYVALFEPVASTMEMQGEGFIVAAIGEASGEVPYTAMMVTKEYLAKNKDILQSYINALYKGQKWVQSHNPSEIAEAIRPSFPDSSIELLTSVAKRYKDIDAWMSDPILKEDAFNNMQGIIEEAGIITKRADYNKIVDNSFAKKAVEKIK